MNTRQGDFDVLEKKLSEKKSRVAKATLEKVHKQSKNQELERLRKLYIDALKRKEFLRAAEIKAHIEKSFPR